jgi:Amiloride-sensitive sodium channel
MFFKEDHFIPYKRSEMFSQTDLMTNASGLFGLFVGVSLMCVLKTINDCLLGLQWQRHSKKKVNSPAMAMTSMSQTPAQS